ncbi:MAG TPA: trypsin-like peptidase domain-containing protein [Candidatus Dormibacteraeota bacterium]|nr:trypsin-like peptidase domain-containing protein [Candidatus Dormibacteraeota bacterium]
MSNPGSRLARTLAAALVAGVAAAAGLAWQAQQDGARTSAAQQQTLARLQTEVNELQTKTSQQADWSKLAAQVEPSVFTIATDAGLGSGWVVREDASGSDLVTDYHVVADALASGVKAVDVIQADRTLEGTIVHIDRTDDLALVHVNEKLTPLKPAPTRPSVGATVMVVGSPLGLGGSVSIGLVSGFRSIEGSDYVQFSAPISPGNSGGPVVDSKGHVIGVAKGKFVGDGVEALGFAIPVSVACAQLGVCEET